MVSDANEISCGYPVWTGDPRRPYYGADATASTSYPAGFTRAGGLKLPLNERREALLEIAKQTQNADITQTIVIVTRIVREKWGGVAKQPGDMTQLTYGPPSVAQFRDPDAHQKALDTLANIPAIPCFATVLDAEEARTWAMLFRDCKTQAEIGEAIGVGQCAVSRIMDRAVNKMGTRFRELRDRDELPIEILAWLQENAPPDENLEFAAAVAALLKRDKALRKGDLKNADTGCNDLNALSFRDA